MKAAAPGLARLPRIARRAASCRAGKLAILSNRSLWRFGILTLAPGAHQPADLVE